MRMLALCLVLLVTLTSCESKASKVKRLQDQYNTEYPAYARECLDDETAGAARMLTGDKLTKEQEADLEAKKKERDARCKPIADRLGEIQKQILAAQQ